MKFQYTIKNGADPENPNEQEAGVSITDDRLYNKDVILVSYGAQSYTGDFFTKNKLSNKITLTPQGMAFPAGSLVVIQTL